MVVHGKNNEERIIKIIGHYGNGSKVNDHENNDSDADCYNYNDYNDGIFQDTTNWRLISIVCIFS